MTITFKRDLYRKNKKINNTYKNNLNAYKKSCKKIVVKNKTFKGGMFSRFSKRAKTPGPDIASIKTDLKSIKDAISKHIPLDDQKISNLLTQMVNSMDAIDKAALSPSDITSATQLMSRFTNKSTLSNSAKITKLKENIIRMINTYERMYEKIIYSIPDGEEKNNDDNIFITKIRGDATELGQRGDTPAPENAEGFTNVDDMDKYKKILTRIMSRSDKIKYIKESAYNPTMALKDELSTQINNESDTVSLKSECIQLINICEKLNILCKEIRLYKSRIDSQESKYIQICMEEVPKKTISMTVPPNVGEAKFRKDTTSKYKAKLLEFKTKETKDEEIVIKESKQLLWAKNIEAQIKTARLAEESLSKKSSFTVSAKPTNEKVLEVIISALDNIDKILYGAVYTDLRKFMNETFHDDAFPPAPPPSAPPFARPPPSAPPLDDVNPLSGFAFEGSL
jgi:hypothetical protein